MLDAIIFINTSDEQPWDYETVGLRNSPYFAPAATWDRSCDLPLSVEFRVVPTFLRVQPEAALIRVDQQYFVLHFCTNLSRKMLKVLFYLIHSYFKTNVNPNTYVNPITGGRESEPHTEHQSWGEFNFDNKPVGYT